MCAACKYMLENKISEVYLKTTAHTLKTATVVLTSMYNDHDCKIKLGYSCQRIQSIFFFFLVSAMV